MVLHIIASIGSHAWNDEDGLTSVCQGWNALRKLHCMFCLKLRIKYVLLSLHYIITTGHPTTRASRASSYRYMIRFQSMLVAVMLILQCALIWMMMMQPIIFHFLIPLSDSYGLSSMRWLVGAVWLEPPFQTCVQRWITPSI